MSKEMNEEELQKEYSFKVRILLYLKRVLISIILNIIIAGVIVIVFQLVYKTGINKECFANAMLGTGMVYLLNCVVFFQRDIYEHQRAMKRSYSNPRISEKKILAFGVSDFNNTETLALTAICSALTIGIAYFIAIY